MKQIKSLSMKGYAPRLEVLAKIIGFEGTKNADEFYEKLREKMVTDYAQT